jgi:thiamine-monophosphate kinase
VAICRPLPDRLTIDSFVLGHCRRGRAIRRSGARVGEAIYLTGEIGASAAGLRLLLGGQRVERGRRMSFAALRAHLAPDPTGRIWEASWRVGPRWVR